jgi:hypothetical protein
MTSVSASKFQALVVISSFATLKLCNLPFSVLCGLYFHFGGG